MTEMSGGAGEQPVQRVSEAAVMTVRTGSNSRPKRSPCYALVTIGAVCAQISAGIVLSGLSMFIDRIRADLWPDGQTSRAQVQSVYTVLLLVAIAMMPIAGRLIGRWGGRRLLLIGGTISSLGLAAMSTAQGMGGLYAFAIITGLGFGMSVNYVPVILVNSWFHKHKGVIMGVTVAGTGLGGILSSLVFTNTNQPVSEGGLGWRASMLIGAGLYAFFCLVPAWLLVVNKPSDVGLPIYGKAAVGVDVATVRVGEVPVEQVPGLRLGQALRSGWFWLLYAMVTLLGVFCAMGQITQPFFINQQTYPGSGMTPGLAGTLMTTQMVGLIMAKPVLGWLIEAIGMVKAMIILMAIHGVAGYLLGTIVYPASGWIFLVIGLVGAGFAVGSLTPPLACGLAFGQRDYASIYGVLGSAYALGLAIGSVLWSIAGTIAADPDQPWQLYREAMKWCWLLSIVIITGYLFAIRGGRRAQCRLQSELTLN
ncbi:MFS transporter [Brooklawnia propionicigenes]|uniref:MFS transporter n=1 Tax=Brooklawnia propionicigenes TaxID=3041175 RepID=A0AAN0K9U6_9ACTN|nr:MFS transporter [Brooklawnia sp. SH051]BEH00755.1 MFS transporter [Brooklawnia sp. SH051]